VCPSPLALAPDVPGCATIAPISLEHTTTTLPMGSALTKPAVASATHRQVLSTLAALHSNF